MEALYPKVPAVLPVKFKFKSVAIEVVLLAVPEDKNTSLVEVVASLPIAVLLLITLKELVDAVVVRVAIGIVPVVETATVLKLVGSVVIPLKF